MSIFMKNLFLQIRSIFRETRCILCSRPFNPPLFSSKTRIHTIDSLDFVSIEDVYILLDLLCKKHIHSHLCPQCAPYAFSKELNTEIYGEENILDGKFIPSTHSQEIGISIKTSSYCLACGEIFHEDMSQYSEQRLCAQCTQKKPEWTRFDFVNSYCGTLRKLILKAKFHNSKTSLAFLGKLLAYTWFIKTLEDRKAPFFGIHDCLCVPNLIIPMPLHTIRLKERGYNQCILLGNYFLKELALIGKICGLKPENMPLLDTKNLIRVHYTQAQSELSQKEREQNVKNVFDVLHAKYIKDKHILLLDDIATTNSTLKEATNSLLKAGALRVDILVIAKTPH